MSEILAKDHISLLHAFFLMDHSFSPNVGYVCMWTLPEIE